MHSWSVEHIVRADPIVCLFVSLFVCLFVCLFVHVRYTCADTLSTDELNFNNQLNQSEMNTTLPSANVI